MSDSEDLFSDISEHSEYVPDSETESNSDTSIVVIPPTPTKASSFSKLSRSNKSLKRSPFGTITDEILDQQPSTSQSGQLKDEGSGNKTIQRGRKRKANKSQWKRIMTKKLRQSGKEYVNTKGLTVSAKKINIRKDCSKCRFKCGTKFSRNELDDICLEFWSLSDDEKNNFYDKTTDRKDKSRTRPSLTLPASRKVRSYSYSYYFVVGGERVRVCKAFYLGVLNISQRRISYFHENKKVGLTGIPEPDKRGKATQIRIPECDRDMIRKHINSIPRVPAHYCRQDTKKEYFEHKLNLTVMYTLYKDYCREKECVPQKKWLYEHIFNTEFNIEFHKPKKDRCEVCVAFEMSKKESNVSEEERVNYNKHVNEKEFARNEKMKDKGYASAKVCVLCFDMQSVLSCPQSTTSVFYYKRKYAVYNLTGCDVQSKQGYCMLWHEGLAGRSGNDVSSALIVMLEKIIITRPEIEHIILWSDSCVPQNRNSFMSSAILEFLKKYPSIKSIEQKFQEPGHSAVQEVDNIHSVLDKSLKNCELHSPVSIMRAIINCKSRKPYTVVQIRKEHFKDYKSVAKLTNLDKVPYAKVKHITYNQGSNCVKFRISLHQDAEVVETPIHKSKRTRRGDVISDIPLAKISKVVPVIDKLKIRH